MSGEEGRGDKYLLISDRKNKNYFEWIIIINTHYCIWHDKTALGKAFANFQKSSKCEVSNKDTVLG